MGVCGTAIRQESRINMISHPTVNAPCHWTNSSKKHNRFFKTKGSYNPALSQRIDSDLIGLEHRHIFPHGGPQMTAARC